MTNEPADVPTVRLGNELTVSAIGFGAMALTPVYGDVDDTESLATLNHCLDLGVTFIDTANVYGGGDNGRLIAKLLADRRDESRWRAMRGSGSRRPRRLRAAVRRRRLRTGGARSRNPRSVECRPRPATPTSRP